MMQKKFVFLQLSRYVCTRRIQFPFKDIHVVSFSDNDDIICCFVSRGRHIYCVISLFSCSSVKIARAERLHVGDCLYKCWCVLKVSILMSTMRKNSILASFKGHALKSTIILPILCHLHLSETTYNAYFSISHFTDSFTSPIKVNSI